ncbi:MAG: LeuA family protein [Humidesulfovibrio sp.]|nr:LeuA family protein [Humidesulfovibrio sp.]
MLIDSTLREGAQAYGVYFDNGAKRRMAELLASAGVDELECGWLGQQDLREFLLWAQGALPGSENDARDNGSPALSLWCPCREAAVREAARLAKAGLVHRLNIGAPSSALHREKRLGLSQPEMAARVRTVVATAKAEGVGYISVGLEDISRADPDEALALGRAAVEAGASRLRLSDTVGLLTPLATAALVRRFVAELSVPVALHAHNDLGMATANAVTALECGASFVDVSVLGLGERAGIASLEQVAAWIGQQKCLNDKKSYDLLLLRALCLLASQAAKTPVARNRPVVGEDVFAAESGIHVHGLLRDPALFEPFAPETVGATRRVGVGAKSGGAALTAAITRLRGVGAADSGLMSRVRDLAERLGRPLTDKELLGVL